MDSSYRYCSLSVQPGQLYVAATGQYRGEYEGEEGTAAPSEQAEAQAGDGKEALKREGMSAAAVALEAAANWSWRDPPPRIPTRRRTPKVEEAEDLSKRALHTEPCVSCKPLSDLGYSLKI